MATEGKTWLFGQDVTSALSGPWVAFWVVFLRVLVGTRFMHAGMDKFLAEQPFDASWWLAGPAGGGILGPLMTWFAQNAPWFVNVMIPMGELLIGIGLILGAFTRLASFFGASLMAFLYFGNADFTHGFINGDFLNLVLFITLIVFDAGRIWGLDAYLEQTETVKQHPRLRDFLG